jgi:hypothetical protein
MLLSGSFSTFERSNNRVYDKSVFQNCLNELNKRVTKELRIYKIKIILNIC